MIPQHRLTELVSKGYLIVEWSGPYVSTIKEFDGQDKIVLFKYVDGQFVLV